MWNNLGSIKNKLRSGIVIFNDVLQSRKSAKVNKNILESPESLSRFDLKFISEFEAHWQNAELLVKSSSSKQRLLFRVKVLQGISFQTTQHHWSKRIQFTVYMLSDFLWEKMKLEKNAKVLAL